MLGKIRSIVIINIVVTYLSNSCTSSTKEQDTCQFFENKINVALKKVKTKLDSLAVLHSENSKLLKSKSCKDLHLFLADMYYDLGDEKNAIQNYYIALSIDSADIYSLFKLSLIYYDNNNYDTSIHILNKIIDFKTIGIFKVDIDEGAQGISKTYDVPLTKIRYYLGLNYYYKGNFQLAMINLNSCEGLKYNLDNVHLYKGAIYIESKQFSKACSEFEIAKKMGNIDAENYLKRYCNSLPSP